ncbi:MAG: hypothetical protein AAGL17_23065, partial [Cyanobacteria bacterium J06576_12]
HFPKPRSTHFFTSGKPNFFLKVPKPLARNSLVILEKHRKITVTQPREHQQTPLVLKLSTPYAILQTT